MFLNEPPGLIDDAAWCFSSCSSQVVDASQEAFVFFFATFPTSTNSSSTPTSLHLPPALELQSHSLSHVVTSHLTDVSPHTSSPNGSTALPTGLGKV
eukprot:CAMPEP_0175819714 /NCGR_PEP_ID=MMETSP0107_2-20121207/8215_1 /TAXON_ID=195067 ORGANISM="Goniomonas pacifica, Strain CCMP1869" /NCGR_SAMPLE_ID=MMETSP0107_2 /ASSEMBLY_ACC=CAM_ASM_000203 /LENGTH=96 /DNA_ID=CAMNT_0017131977 /DNA_START=721 /DNA_END=1011 /DNA_ORIENTATION=-